MLCRSREVVRGVGLWLRATVEIRSSDLRVFISLRHLATLWNCPRISPISRIKESYQTEAKDSWNSWDSWAKNNLSGAAVQGNPSPARFKSANLEEAIGSARVDIEAGFGKTS